MKAEEYDEISRESTPALEAVSPRGDIYSQAAPPPRPSKAQSVSAPLNFSRSRGTVL
jgi:hypothetical protein